MTTYVCGYCEKAFNELSTFKIHTRVNHHYVFCYVCDSFLHVSQLSKHLKKNHPKQYANLKWTCKFCGDLLLQDRYKKGKIIESKKHKCPVTDYFKLMQPLKIESIKTIKNNKKISIENSTWITRNNMLTRKYKKINKGLQYTFGTTIYNPNLSNTNSLIEKIYTRNCN